MSKTSVESHVTLPSNTHTHPLKKTSETKSSLGQLVTHHIESQQVGRSDSLCSSSHSVCVCAFVCLCVSTPLKGSLIESIQFPRPRWVLATQQAAGTEQGQTVSTEAVWRYTTDSLTRLIRLLSSFQSDAPLGKTASRWQVHLYAADSPSGSDLYVSEQRLFFPANILFRGERLWRVFKRRKEDVFQSL